MITQYHKLALTAAFVLAMAFTFSCSSGDDDNNNSGGGSPVTGGADGGGNQFSQIYNEDGTAYNGSGVIKIQIYGLEIDDGFSPDTDTLIDAGKVTNGIVTLDLPTNIHDKYLIKNFVDNDVLAPCFGDLKYLPGGRFVLTNNNKNYIGNLDIFYEDENVAENFYEAIEYWYFSKAGKVACNLQDDDADAFYRKQIINIDAKKGWNKIYLRVIYRKEGIDGIRTGEISTNNIITKEVKWTIQTTK